ncbi:MAG TPA: RluA family pseudouridine synthase [Acidimicrobiia bacterium]|nr:RluA family pseudouridine synthase [Acidimicrobiia bacterium]
MTSIVVPGELDGERADKVIAVLLDIARSESRGAFDEGRVSMGGHPVKPGQRLAQGDEIEVELAVRSVGIVADGSVPFSVVYEDADLVVVDKPVGVVVHPPSDRSAPSLVHGLIARYPEIVGVGVDGRWGIVHRLDRDTSGLLVVARTHRAHEALSGLMRSRRVSRRYVALVSGAFDAARGTIDAPIGRDPSNPTRMRIDRGGRKSVTHYRRLATWVDHDLSLVYVALETGRTHQIRVHMQAIDHPIVGDPSYGRTGGVGDPGRPWLHAQRLVFDHPFSDRVVDVTAELPGDLVDSLSRIGPPTSGSIDDIAEELP